MFAKMLLYSLMTIPRYEMRPTVVVAVDGDSELMRSEWESEWRPRVEADADACAYVLELRRRVRSRWRVEFIDKYDLRHPGYPALRFGYRKWERLTPEFWLCSTASIEWLEWRSRVYVEGVKFVPEYHMGAMWDDEWMNRADTLPPEPPWPVRDFSRHIYARPSRPEVPPEPAP